MGYTSQSSVGVSLKIGRILTILPRNKSDDYAAYQLVIKPYYLSRATVWATDRGQFPRMLSALSVLTRKKQA
jgi:hypothetical protein